MSRNFPQSPEQSLLFSEEAPLISIIASEYNASFVDAMLEQTQQELRKLDSRTIIKVIRVPGALEIPLLVKLVAERHKSSAIIALGVIIRGETAHADLIAEAITHALLNLSLDYCLPVIHEVLLLNNEEQAQVRCVNGPLYRGVEAARAAIGAIAATRF